MFIRNHASRVAGVACLASLAFLASACGAGSDGGSSSVPSAKVDGVAMSIPGALPTLDPAKGSSAQAAIAAWASYDTLVGVDSDGSVVPQLASKWTVTPTSATFDLKSGVTCSDGTALTAKDVAASLNRFFDPKTAAPLRGLVVGAGNATATAGDNQVTIKLSAPWSQLLAGLSTPFTGIICPKGLSDPNSLTTKTAGTGPWVATDQTAGSSYSFSYHDGYSWGAQLAHMPKGDAPRKLVMKVVADENTMANLVSTGELQVGSFSSDSWKKFKNASNATIDTRQFYDTILQFNENKGHPTADKAVRLAIAQAVDRAQLNDVQSYGAGKVLNNLGQPNYDCYDESLASKIPATDTEAASKTLKGVKIRIIGTNVLSGGDANNYLLEALRAAGADADLRNMSNEQWIGDLFSAKNDWDVNLYVQGVPFTNMLLTALNFIGAPPPNGQNLGNVQNTTAAEALGRYTTSEGDESCKAMTELQTALFDGVDAVPMASVPAHIVYAGGVGAVAAKGYVLPATIRVAN